MVRFALVLIVVAMMMLACDDESPVNTPPPAEGSEGAWLVEGKWHYRPADSTCDYGEVRRVRALHRDFKDTDVLLMEAAETCPGTWYIFYPETGVPFGGITEPRNARLSLKLKDGKVVVDEDEDGCRWEEARRQQSSASFGSGTIVVLATSCDVDYALWYSSATGALDSVIP